MRFIRSIAPLVVLALLGCGGGATAVHVPPDGGDAAVDRVEGGDAAAGDPDSAGQRDAGGGDLEAEAPADADDDGGDAMDVAAPDGGTDVAGDGARDASPDTSSDAGDAASDVADDGAKDAPLDLPVERPSATASWTIAPFAMCTAAGAGCMDTGGVGGYQITASGSCPAASSVQLWFPGGAAPIAAGAYAVKPAAGILDVISMPAGMVGVTAERDDAAKTHFKYWGRAGTVTVAVVGAGRRVTFSGVTLREETSAAMTTLGADVSCP